MKNVGRVLGAMVAVAMVASSAQAGYGSKKQDIVDTAIAAGNFTTLAAALTEADLVGALQGKGPFTVFAPTDDAFAKLPQGTVESLLKPENRDQLVAILTYHVVPGRLDASGVVQSAGAQTLNGQQLKFSVKDGNVSIGDALVTATDIGASNGIIHVVDTVLLPESETIVGVAAKAGTFHTLLAAVQAAGLDGVLAGDGPFTVFAPTDAAFAKLPAGTVESLLKEENVGKLQSILKYHVVSGRTFSSDVLKQTSIRTLAGMDVAVSMKDGVARVNKSALVATDINASNGVIHVIDTVMLPPEQHSSVATPADLIEMAMERGAPLCSQGNAAG
ncbi:MAG: hypothetical protein DHS20C21_11230 [Gemmatimonadota bacterium]|nr:MAG: hypothetical protein DHS20C21_11230 [Gemmatimonadota bacterium]